MRRRCADGNVIRRETTGAPPLRLIPPGERLGEGQRGAFLILASVFLLIILAFLGAVFLTTFTTGTATATNELQSTRAFYVAEGGLAFHQRDLALDLDWYRSATDPLLTTTNKDLGAGKFTATSSLPASMLRNRIPNGASTAPVRAYTTERFPGGLPTDPPQPWYIQLEDDMNGGAEYLQYTALVGDTFAGTVTRNVTIGGVVSASGAAPHARGSRIYPVTRYLGYNGLPNSLPANCNPVTSLELADHPKLLRAGTIAISTYNAATLSVAVEEISYAGADSTGGTLVLRGVSRCQNGTPGLAHAVGNPVTPLLYNAAAPDFEVEVVSTGTAGTTVRVARNTVQR